MTAGHRFGQRAVRRAAGLLAALLLVLACGAAETRAAEEILGFESHIEVRSDGTLVVTETIAVRAEGHEIRRGIYRDIPTVRYDQSGLRHTAGLTVIDVLRDGRPTPWHSERQGDGIRIYIGEESTWLDPGRYTYTIRYQTTRQLGHFDDFDELYWNVTGNFWSFPIRRAVARVDLPAGAEVLRHAAYTGGFGGRGTDWRASEGLAHDIVFETTRPLGAREGLTIAVAWQKGLVPAPSRAAQRARVLLDNLGFLVLVVGTAVVTVLFAGLWWAFGRDPEPGTVIPLFEPPAGLSPAAVSYIHHMGLKQAGRGASRAFLAALMSLAVKGRIRIAEEGDTIAVERAGGDGAAAATAAEAAIERGLVGARQRIVFDRANGQHVIGARNKFRSALVREHGNVFFRNNYGHFAIAAVLSALTLAGAFYLQQPRDFQVILMMISFAAAVVGSLLIAFGGRRLLGWLPGGTGIVERIVGFLALLAGLAAIVPAALAALAPLQAFWSLIGHEATGREVARMFAIPVAVPIALATLGAVNVAFFHLLRAPTVVGRRTMDEIEGFKMYLSVAEAERMNLAGAPDLSQTLFERYLPYAIGLGVEKPWSEAFEQYLARTVPEAQRRSYSPSWYRGSSWNASSIGRATTGVVSAVSSGMARSMPSGSGSGGGGFSGGGGGGGGGGGW